MSDVEYAECSVCGIGSEVTRLWFDSEDDTVPPYYLSLCHQCKPRLTRPNDAKYEELLMAVARKFPNESRHETALRYITEAESKDYGTASEGCKQSSEGK